MTETDDIVERLRAWDKAYPEDMFPPVNDLEAIQLRNTHPGLIDRLSAMMGRHLAKFAKEAITHITRREERCASLEGQVEAGAAEIERLRGLFRLDGDQHAAHIKALTEAHEARITKYAEAVTGLRSCAEATERERDEALASKQWAEARLDAAAGEAAALKEEVARLREALEPFASIEIDGPAEIVPNGYDPQPWREHVLNARAALQPQEPNPNKGGAGE